MRFSYRIILSIVFSASGLAVYEFIRTDLHPLTLVYALGLLGGGALFLAFFLVVALKWGGRWYEEPIRWIQDHFRKPFEGAQASKIAAGFIAASLTGILGLGFTHASIVFWQNNFRSAKLMAVGITGLFPLIWGGLILFLGIPLYLYLAKKKLRLRPIAYISILILGILVVRFLAHNADWILLVLEGWFRTAVILATVALLTFLAFSRIPKTFPSKKVVMGISFFFVLFFVFSLAHLGRHGKSAAAIIDQTTFSASAVRTIQFILDLDRDGYSVVLGGGDCNDFNRSISPSAFEVPKNGIDENCFLGDFDPGKVKPPSFPPKSRNHGKFADYNFLVVIIDSLRSDVVGQNIKGRYITPTLNDLFKFSVRMPQAFAPPSTQLSFPGLLTGRYPGNIRFNKEVGAAVALDDMQTIAELFKKKGFQTAAIFPDEFFHDPANGLLQGFDQFPSFEHSQALHPPADVVAGKAEEIFKSFGKKKFFMFVHFEDPHYAYLPHPEFDFGDTMVQRYLGEVAFADHHLGLLFRKMEKMGVLKNTIIAVVSDHGEAFGEHGKFFHEQVLYSEISWIPMAFFVPGIKAQDIKTPATLIDVGATFLDLAGIVPEEEIDGWSFLPAMEGQKIPERTVFLEIFKTTHYNKYRMAAAVQFPWKLIHNLTLRRFELFDLSNDPYEQKNLYSQHHPQAKALTRELFLWYERGHRDVIALHQTN